MKRRDFNKTAMFATTLAVIGHAAAKNTQAETHSRKKIYPARLRPGDAVGIIAPASSFPPERMAKTEENMRSLSLKIKWGKNINAQHGFLAGTDNERLEDLHAMFRDPSVRAIWCIRGGYGCTRLLDRIDYRMIKKNPKILIGYSDVTALHVAIQQHTGLITFHGPVGSSTFSDYTLKHVQAMLFETAGHTILQAEDYHENARPGFESYVITPGVAKGELTGGNLSLLAAMCGTKYQLNVHKKILFIEDIGEKPYRIDRMLTQLRQNNALHEAAGIALGIFDDCQADPEDRSLTLREVLEDRLGDLGIPVAYGFSFGHITDQCTLPVGGRAQMNTGSMRLIVEGSVV